ncbi:MAG: CoA-binding protein [Candidatus Diapherotrites archaeon]|nr:CoA-binding protein [Candidatus Diapherotrites archaeon]
MKPHEQILLSAKTIAVVGLSRDPKKDSHSVAKYLQEKGYKIIPVNPSGGELLGEKVYTSLSEIKVPVGIVDVFRPSEECAEIAEQAIKLRPKMVWLQLGITSEKAREICEKAGVVFVQNHCIRTEHKRLAGTGF